MYGLYVITDEQLSNGSSHAELARLACEGGADVIQLRDKTMDRDEFMRTAAEIRRITSSYGVLFIVNDRVDVAIDVKADGVHVGQSDMALTDAVKVKGDMLIGVSAGDLEEALTAERGGADYIGYGPIFTTTSKHDARAAVGTDRLRDIVNKLRIPVVAIGGISKENAADVVRAGADGIAVISAVVSQKDVKKAAEELKNIILSASVRA